MIGELTALERRCLEHLRLAHAQGMGLTAYARSTGLKFRMLYDAKCRLIEKGVDIGGCVAAARTRGTAGNEQGGASGFVAVRVAESARSPGLEAPILRVRHAEGHVLEFGSWPPAELMARILAGGVDAAA